MAAIVQWLERLIVVQDVEGSNPSSRPIYLPRKLLDLENLPAPAQNSL